MTVNTNFNAISISRALKDLENDSHYVRLCLMLLQTQIQTLKVPVLVLKTIAK